MNKNVNKTNNIIILVTVLGMVFVLSLFLFVNIENNRVIKRNISEYQTEYTADTVYEIKNIESDTKGNVYIDGIFAVKGLSYDFFNYANDNHDKGVYAYYHFCLIDENEVYVMPTKLSEDNEINEMLNDGNNYRYSVFDAKVPKKYAEALNSFKRGIVSRSPDGKESIYIYGQQH